MPVRVMHVGHMPMPVFQPLMPVPVSVRLARWVIGRMFVLMVLVVNMQVFVLHRLMHVLMVMVMVMVFRHMQPKAPRNGAVEK